MPLPEPISYKTLYFRLERKVNTGYTSSSYFTNLPIQAHLFLIRVLQEMKIHILEQFLGVYSSSWNLAELLDRFS